MTDGFDSDGMPTGWRQGPSLLSKSKFHDIVVDDFLMVTRWAQTDPELLAKGSGEGVSIFGGEARSRRFSNSLHRLLRERLRDARVFEIVPDLFIRIDGEVDRYLTEELAGLTLKLDTIKETPWGKVVERVPISQEDLTRYSKAVRRASAEIGVPNPRPFDVMWLGMGSMITLSSRLLAIQSDVIKGTRSRIIKAPSVVGMVISDDFCCEVDACTLENERGRLTEHVMLIPLWAQDMWLSPELGHPWTLNAIVEILNQQDVYVETPIIDKRKFSQRRWWQQKTKKMGIKGAVTVLPPMYYSVTIKPSTYTEKAKLAMQSARNWTHRWDVRGHPITKGTAGSKPMLPRIRRALLAKGYTIIEDPDELTDQQAAILLRHKKPMPSNSVWAAVKIGYRKSFVKGPIDKPYIPATWRLREEGKE